MQATLAHTHELEAIRYAMRVTEYRLLTEDLGTERHRRLRGRLSRLADRLRAMEAGQPGRGGPPPQR